MRTILLALLMAFTMQCGVAQAENLSLKDQLDEMLNLFYPEYCSFNTTFKLTDDLIVSYNMGDGHVLYSIYCGKTSATSTRNQGQTLGHTSQDVYYWIYQKNISPEKYVFQPLYFQYPQLKNEPYGTPELAQIGQWIVKPELDVLEYSPFSLDIDTGHLEAISCHSEDCVSIQYYKWVFKKNIGFSAASFGVEYQKEAYFELVVKLK